MNRKFQPVTYGMRNRNCRPLWATLRAATSGPRLEDLGHPKGTPYGTLGTLGFTGETLISVAAVVAIYPLVI